MTAAQNETLNNTCAPDHNCGTLKSAIADTGRAAWNTALGVVQSIPNAVNGALPGYPDYVPFLSGAMLPHDDPDFGGLVSLVGTVWALSALGGSSAGGATVGDAVPAAGSIRNVNPTGGDMNCVNCAIATDATLRGNPASALPGSPTSLVVLQQQFGSRFAPATTSSIEQSLLQQGNGATGIVYGFPPAGSDVGHVFNVVNQNGTIRYLDGQTGTVANPAVFPKLLFMPVKPIGAK